MGHYLQIFSALLGLAIGSGGTYFTLEARHDRELKQASSVISGLSDTYTIAIPATNISIIMDIVEKVEKEVNPEFYRKACLYIKVQYESLSSPINGEKYVKREQAILQRAREFIRKYEAKGLCDLKDERT